MYSDGTFVDHLSRHECLRRLESVPVGRIVYTRQALPAVELVNFAIDGGDIVIRTDTGSKLAAATQGTVVAFQADSMDPDHDAGWSVTGIGRSREVIDPEDIGHLRKIGLRAWAPGTRDHFIRIAPEILTGQLLRADGAKEQASPEPMAPGP
jgi:nitroimidazol reductase NimA-like FMN-containing flavoprotein (pyridoxamine 5'-phosphate oxidase superfamily)